MASIPNSHELVGKTRQVQSTFDGAMRVASNQFRRKRDLSEKDGGKNQSNFSYDLENE